MFIHHIIDHLDSESESRGSSGPAEAGGCHCGYVAEEHHEPGDGGAGERTLEQPEPPRPFTLCKNHGRLTTTDPLIICWIFAAPSHLFYLQGTADLEPEDEEEMEDSGEVLDDSSSSPSSTLRNYPLTCKVLYSYKVPAEYTVLQGTWTMFQHWPAQKVLPSWRERWLPSKMTFSHL